MSCRRRHQEEHENHERWLVSYADFITLLFAFFVVMYAVSSVNEGKMRVLSDSLVATFSSRQKSLSPVQVGKLVRSRIVDDTALITKPGEVPARKQSEITHEESSAKGDSADGSTDADGDTHQDADEDTHQDADEDTHEETQATDAETGDPEAGGAVDTAGAEGGGEGGPGTGQEGDQMRDVDTIADQVEQDHGVSDQS